MSRRCRPPRTGLQWPLGLDGRLTCCATKSLVKRSSRRREAINQPFRTQAPAACPAFSSPGLPTGTRARAPHPPRVWSGGRSDPRTAATNAVASAGSRSAALRSARRRCCREFRNVTVQRSVGFSVHPLCPLRLCGSLGDLCRILCPTRLWPPKWMRKWGEKEVAKCDISRPPPNRRRDEPCGPSRRLSVLCEGALQAGSPAAVSCMPPMHRARCSGRRHRSRRHR